MIRRPRALILPCLLALLAALFLLPTGCAHMPRMLGGTGDVTLVLDGEQNHETSLPLGRALTLDLRDPAQSGYVFAGTSFDPNLLRLDSVIPGPGGRVRYQFATLAAGQADIQLKIRKEEPGYRPDVFKRVRVVIEPK